MEGDTLKRELRAGCGSTGVTGKGSSHAVARTLGAGPAWMLESPGPSRHSPGATHPLNGVKHMDTPV